MTEKIKPIYSHILYLLFFLSIVFLPFLVFAQDSKGTEALFNGLEKTAEDTYDTGVSQSSLGQTIADILNTLFSVLGVIFLLLVIYSGFLWMTARGNDEQVAKAKKILEQVVIGIIIVVAAYGITYFVLSNIAGAGKNGETENTGGASSSG